MGQIRENLIFSLHAIPLCTSTCSVYEYNYLQGWGGFPHYFGETHLHEQMTLPLALYQAHKKRPSLVKYCKCVWRSLIVSDFLHILSRL